MLRECREPLWERHDVAMLDLDGVVYIGARAVPDAPEHLAAAARSGMHLAYVTNNASRPPSVVAGHLRDLGIEVADHDVVNSAQAAARLLRELVPAGSPVFVIGGRGLFEALEEQRLRPVQSLADQPVAVVSGYHPDLRWRTVIDGAILVREGLPWVASNTDLTVPTARGVGPGNGVLVDAVARFAGRRAQVAGKPEPPLFEETRRRVGGVRPLVVGDRLDTDIAGAVNVGFDSLLVMTGVTGAEELVRAAPGERPTYLSATLAGLGQPHPVPERRGDTWRLDGWTAEVRGEEVFVTGEGSVDDWWRVVAHVAWMHLDDHGRPVGTGNLRRPR